MRKSVLISSVIGIIFCCAMAYMASQIALFTIQGDPEVQNRFLGSVFINQLAAILTYIAYSDHCVRRSLDVLASHRFFRISLMDITDAILVICFLVTAAQGVGEDPGHFRALMSFVTFPCGLIALVCLTILVNEFDRPRSSQDPPLPDHFPE